MRMLFRLTILGLAVWREDPVRALRPGRPRGGGLARLAEHGSVRVRFVDDERRLSAQHEHGEHQVLSY